MKKESKLWDLLRTKYSAITVWTYHSGFCVVTLSNLYQNSYLVLAHGAALSQS